MQKNLIKIILIVLSVATLLLCSFGAGIFLGLNSPAKAFADALTFNLLPDFLRGPIEASSSGDEDLDELFAPFWESWSIINNQYVNQPLDKVKLMQGAIRGMLQSLEDPYTSYMDPFQFQQNNAALEGDYEGIGAWVDITGEYLAIISPMPNSPAERAGLQPGDVVTAIDGEDMAGIPGELVLRRILGPAGTDVVLTIRREGVQEALEFAITRENIVIPSIEADILEDNIAYIRLYTFGEDTASDMRREITRVLEEKPAGLILDLRNNSGGYLTSAVDVVSEFIEPNKVVLYQEYGDGTRQISQSKSGGKALDIPLVVLVNEGSASASEITAGAIQDYGRGMLVGVTTFGKGLVQSWVPLRGENGAVSVTIAYWLTPNERQIHQQGLEPDVIVEITAEDIEEGRDPQLEKAIELLLK